jgi:hypothetical protein
MSSLPIAMQLAAYVASHPNAQLTAEQIASRFGTERTSAKSVFDSLAKYVDAGAFAREGSGATAVYVIGRELAKKVLP